MIDSLFTRDESVTYASKVGEMVRGERWKFLHKGAWHRFRGYTHSRMKKIKAVGPKGKQPGYDVKDAYHAVRLLDELEQILEFGDIDLMRSREQLKEVRAGNWTYDRLVKYCDEKERHLEDLYHSSPLRKEPDVDVLRQLLLDCLEEFHGTVSQGDLVIANDAGFTLRKIKEIISKY